MGPTFHIQLFDIHQIDAVNSTRAYMAVKEITQSDQLINDIQKLDNKVSAQTQLYCQLKVVRFLESSILWLTNNKMAPIDINHCIKQFSKGFSNLSKIVENSIIGNGKKNYEDERDKLKKQKLPNQIAERIARLDSLLDAFEIIDIGIRCKQDAGFVAKAHFAVQSALHLNWVSREISNLKVENIWHERSISSLSANLKKCHSRVTEKVITSSKSKSAEGRVDHWIAQQQGINSYNTMSKSLSKESNVDMPMFISTCQRTGSSWLGLG